MASTGGGDEACINLCKHPSEVPYIQYMIQVSLASMQYMVDRSMPNLMARNSGLEVSKVMGKLVSQLESAHSFLCILFRY